jgi:feruloyl esterase
MLAPELIRIQEIPLKNLVTPEKTNTIRAEFLRQCDGLDGLYDGIVNNYMAARAIFQRERWHWSKRSLGSPACTKQC